MSDPESMEGLEQGASTRHLVVTRRGDMELELDASGFAAWEISGVVWLLDRMAHQLQDAEDEEAENGG